MAHLSPAAMMIAVAALQQKTPTDGAGFTGHDGPGGASHRPPPLLNSRSGFGTHESCRDFGEQSKRWRRHLLPPNHRCAVSGVRDVAMQGVSTSLNVTAAFALLLHGQQR